jgi:hypothetical protein
LLGVSLPSCCRFNPASVNRRASQFATFHAAFASTEASSANWGFRFSRPDLRSLSLRPDDLLTILKMALSIGIRNSISLLPAIQATRFLTFTLVGLSSTEHTSFFLDTLPYGGFSSLRLQGRYLRQGLPDGAQTPRRSVCLRPSCSPLAAFLLRSVSEDATRLRTSVRATSVALPQGPSLRSELFCLGPSTLNRPHPPHLWAHPDFTALRLIRDALAVRFRLGDPQLVPCFRWLSSIDMSSSGTPGSSSAAFTQFLR